MSLNPQEVQATKKEFQQNLALSGLSIEQIAADLKTTPIVIQQLLVLQARHIEDPWVLKNYLEAQIRAQGQQPIPFSALSGDYHRYWFLNTQRIDQQKIG